MKKGSLSLCLLLAGMVASGQQPATTVPDSNAVKTLFFAGLRDKLNENYSKASESFTKILTLEPNNAAVHYEMANLYYRQNKLVEAELSVKRAVAIEPNNVWYWKLLAELYKRKGDMNELVNVFNQLIRLSPDHEAYYFDKSNAYLLMGKPDEALKGYDLQEKKFGASKALSQARQRVTLGPGKETTKQELEKIITEGQGDVNNMLETGESLLTKGQYQDALTVIKKAKALDPENYEADLALADVYKALKDYTSATTAIRKAFGSQDMPLERKMKIIMMLAGGTRNQQRIREASELTQLTVQQNPDDSRLLALYGDLLYQQGNLSEAMIQYQAALKISDDLYLVWEQLLNIQTSMGLYKQAIKTGDAALAIFPNQAILYYYMAFAYHRENQNVQALGNIKSAQQLDSDNKDLQAMVLALQGEILIDEQQFKAADVAFDKAVALAPANYLILNNYAYYLALRNHALPKAEALISKAAEALPGNASIADTYALVLLKLEKYELAKQWAEQALKTNSHQNGLYLEHYGDILFLKGEQQAGLIQWQKAKDAGNDSEKLNRKINEKKYIK